MREIQKVPPGLARERIEMGAHWTRLAKRLTRKSGSTVHTIWTVLLLYHTDCDCEFDFGNYCTTVAISCL